jgi:hypothetical protein
MRNSQISNNQQCFGDEEKGKKIGGAVTAILFFSCLNSLP